MATYQIGFILFMILVLRGLDSAVYDNGGYNVLVSLDPGLDQDRKEELINVIKDVFAEASATLLKVTKNKAFFKQVKILLPVQWNNDPNIQSASKEETYQNSDIRISDEKFNLETVQPRGCGQEGEYIKVSNNYLLSGDITTKIKAFSLVREWMKFRFGIFNETGFRQDSTYPEVYWSGEGLTVTGCTKTDIWDQKKLNENWKFEKGHYMGYELVKLENITTVPYSIMDNKIMEQAEGFCDNNEHNILAPTQHNSLCMEESVWSVIRKKNELIRDIPAFEIPVSVEFVPIREQMIHPIFVIDPELIQTNEMLLNTITTFFEQEFPDGEKLGIMTVSSDKNSKPYFFDEINKISDLKSGFSNRLNVSSVKIDQQLRSAQVVLRNNAGFVVIICNSDISDDNLRDIREAKSVHWISIGESKPRVSPDIHHYNIPMNTGDVCSFNLRLDLESLLLTIYNEYTSQSQAKLKQISRILLEARDDNTQRSVLVDNTNYKNLKIFFHFCNNLLAFNISNLKTVDINEHSTPVYTNAPTLVSHIPPQTSRITYGLRFKDPVAVSVIREQSGMDSSITAKLYHEIIPIEGSAKPPVVLYAAVFSGGQPITEAEVVASITGPNLTAIFVPLKDNGIGDPDVSLYDGIYSAYFTEFNLQQGWYFVSMKVSYGKPEAENNVLYRYEETVAAQPFFSLERSELDNIYPPNRITDLKIQQMDPSTAEVTLAWTAPGSNLGSHTIFQPNEALDIRCSPDLNNIRNFTGDETGKIACIKSSLLETPPGTNQMCIFQVEDPKVIYYCAIKAKNNRRDRANHRSNIVVVHFPPGYRPSDTTSEWSNLSSTQILIPTPTTVENTKPTNVLSSAELAGIIVAAVLFFLIVLIILICCCCRRKKDNSKEEYPPSHVEIIRRPYEVDEVSYKRNEYDEGCSDLYYIQTSDEGHAKQLESYGSNYDRRNNGLNDESYPRNTFVPQRVNSNPAFETDERAPRREFADGFFPECDRSVVDYEVLPPKPVSTNGSQGSIPATPGFYPHSSSDNYATPPNTPYNGNSNPAFDDGNDDYYDVPNDGNEVYDEVPLESGQQTYANNPPSISSQQSVPTYAQPHKHSDPNQQFPKPPYPEPYNDSPPHSYGQPSEINRSADNISIGPNPQQGKTYRPVLEVHDVNEYPSSLFRSTSTEV